MAATKRKPTRCAGLRPKSEGGGPCHKPPKGRSRFCSKGCRDRAWEHAHYERVNELSRNWHRKNRKRKSRTVVTRRRRTGHKRLRSWDAVYLKEEKTGHDGFLCRGGLECRNSRLGPLCICVRTSRYSAMRCCPTRHPSSAWIVQQLREAFPDQWAPRFLIFDRDAKYGWEVPMAVRSMAIRALRTSFQSPWQNGVAERWV
jgi:hypothetical protein